jgi:hypothetical protein
MKSGPPSGTRNSPPLVESARATKEGTNAPILTVDRFENMELFSPVARFMFPNVQNIERLPPNQCLLTFKYEKEIIQNWDIS